jgi:hypothetical protein
LTQVREEQELVERSGGESEAALESWSLRAFAHPVGYRRKFMTESIRKHAIEMFRCLEATERA